MSLYPHTGVLVKFDLWQRRIFTRNGNRARWFCIDFVRKLHLRAWWGLYSEYIWHANS